MDLNKAMLIGNITRDPEIRQTAGGIPVASFSVATNLSWKDANGQKQDRAEFHNIIAWRSLADIAGRFLKKGSKVFVEGRLQTRSWVGNDGQKRYTTEIVAENIIMLDRANGGQGGYQSPYQADNRPASAPSGQNTASNGEQVITYEDVPQTGGYEESEINVDNIPF